MIVELAHLTIRDLLERSFARFAVLPAIASAGDPALSYAQLQDRVRVLAAELRRRGLDKGDRVAILGENCPNWVIAYLAVTGMGCVAVPILPGFPETDTRHIIRDSESLALFVEAKQRSKIEEAGDLPLRLVIDLDDFSFVEKKAEPPGLIRKAIDLLRKGLGRDEEPKTPEYTTLQEDDLAAIIYTSGTTGFSKGVMLTHKNIVFDVVQGIERFPINEHDRFLSILPLSHTFEATGGLLCPMAVGSSIHYLKGLPTPQKLLAAMEAVKPTAVLTVPLVMDKIYRKRVLPEIQKKALLRKLHAIPLFRKGLHRLAGKKLLKSFGGKLRFFMFGGAALNQDVEVFLREAGISYSTGYGMTETSPIMTINPFGKVRVGSCGRPIPGIEMSIHQPDSRTGVGEIIARGPIVMKGYYKNPEATAEVFLPGGWLKTGDLGAFDAEDYLFIKGRSKNVIVGPSGENIYPEIIEQLLSKSRYVQQTVVYESGGKLVAKAYLDYDVLDQEFARSKLGASQAEQLVVRILDQVRQEVNRELPSFAALTAILEHPEPFEMTPTNKVKRYLYIS